MSVDLNKIQYIPASHHGGVSAGTPKLVVIHDMENAGNIKRGGAKECANFFASPTSPYQAHYTVDPTEMYNCVPLNTVAYHCGNGNTYQGAPSIGIEQTGAATNSRDMWLSPDGTLQVNQVADLTAALCDKFGIRKAFIGVDGLKAGQSGITDHASCSIALGGSSHTDPGPNYPWDVFMARVVGTPSGSPVPPPTPPDAGVKKSMITSAKNADGRLEAFRVTVFGTVQHAWQAASNSKLGSWVDMPLINAAFGLSAVVDIDGRIELFAYSNDYSVWQCWQLVPNGGWSGWVKVG